VAAFAAGFAGHGLNEPISDPVLAVMEVLTLLSAPPLVILMAEVYEGAAPARKVHGLVKFSFATLLAGVTSIVHFVELTAVRQTGGRRDRMAVNGIRGGTARVECVLGLALVFAAPVFDGGGSERAVRRGFSICGILCLAGAVGPSVGNMRLQSMGILGYAVVLPVVCVLLARVFRRGRGSKIKDKG